MSSTDADLQAIIALVALESLLRKWGRFYGDRPPIEVHAASGVSGSLAGTLSRVGMTRKPRETALRRRRRLHAAALSLNDGLTAKGTQTRTAHGSEPEATGWAPSVRWTPDREVVEVEYHWMRLMTAEPAQALALRAEYCRRAPRRVRAYWVAERLGLDAYKMRDYRAALASGMRWMAEVFEPGAVPAVAGQAQRRRPRRLIAA